ncbi:DUF7845 domain-containing protein [Halogranum rubrum]|uniref:DUF7845 domain-containing protein n=1 Tax=Halogranum salarium B-1 TaxID=1210908 RepID=J3F0G3_9EURY|nr:hypothetical protein [Halogranum salarium]EJN61577.1 hypothetical protein HSB1_06180 [Halogranum salarium B-1]
MSDEFDVFDADPVTSDEEDSVGSEVALEETTVEVDGQTVAVEGDSGADVDDDLRASRFDEERREREQAVREQFEAQCIHCRTLFESVDDEAAHECTAEPVASCRFCAETHRRRDDPEDHIYSCREFRRYHEKEIRRSRAEVYRGDGLHAFDDMEYIRPWYHELKGYIKYDCSDQRNPMQSYYALNSLQKEHDWEDHGTLRTGFEVDVDELPQVTRRQLEKADDFGTFDDVEKWAVEFNFKSCGIAPPTGDVADDIDWRLEEVREYIVKVYPSAYQSFEEAKQDGRKRASFTLKPRWPEIESTSGRGISNPYDIAGFDVDTSGSNIQFERYPDLLHRAMEALADRQGFRFDKFTRIRHDDFAPDNIHKSSNITDAELYVRVQKDETGRVYAFDGTLHRVSMLLGSVRRGYAKSVRDDTKCPGYYHTATIGPMRAAEMVGGHDLAKELKHYHVNHPMAVEGGALEHPKIGASFQNSKHDDTVYWSDLERLERELDETILNTLRWSDLPTGVDEDVFVADDYFQVVGDRRFRKVVHDQLPRLREQQDREARQFAVAGNLTQTDIDAVETLLTDGGVVSPADVAEAIGRSISTVYDSLKRLSGIVVHRYGEVELASRYLAQQVLGKLKGARRAVENSLEQSIDDLVRGEKFARADSNQTNPWDRWLGNWVERIDDGGGSAPAKLILGWTPADLDDARELLMSGALRWAEVTGHDLVDFAKEFSPVVETAEGDRLEWSNWHDFAKMLPGFKARYVG